MGKYKHSAELFIGKYVKHLLVITAIHQVCLQFPIRMLSQLSKPDLEWQLDMDT